MDLIETRTFELRDGATVAFRLSKLVHELNAGISPFRALGATPSALTRETTEIGILGDISVKVP